MIRINLLPFRAARKRENIRMQISVYFLSVILLIVVVGLFSLNLYGEIKDLRNKEEKLKKELASYSEMLKRMDALQKKRNDLKNKIDVIQSLEAKKAGPVQLFDEIAMAVPKNKLFLKSIKESKGQVNMTGVAVDNDTVAQFMTNLEKTNTIDAVTLGSTKRTIIEEQEVSNFVLSCVVHKEKEQEKGTRTGKGESGSTKKAHGKKRR